MTTIKPKQSSIISAKPKAATTAIKKKLATFAAKDEMSTGRGSALRARGRLVLGEVAKKLDARPSTLRTEVRGDGKVNCLERAMTLAKPGDRVTLMEDTRDPVGHAVVQRRDGTVVDPNAPTKPYASLDAYRAANPHYVNPVSISDRDAERVLQTPPGLGRDVLLSKLGLNAIADRRVADSGVSFERTAARQVSDAYAAGGAGAGAAKLEEVTRGRTPEEVAAINAAAAGTINSIVSDLRGGAVEHHGGSQYDDAELPAYFDTAVADLSASLGRGASTPEGAAQLDKVSTDIAAAMAEGDGRFDEALGNTAVGGPLSNQNFDKADASLALAVAGKLEAGGNRAAATQVLTGLNNAALPAFNEAGELADKVAGYNAELGYLVQEFGPLGPDKLDQAIAAFHDSHPEYAQLEARGAGTTRVANQLATFAQANTGLADDVGLTSLIGDSAETLLHVAEMSDTAKAELGTFSPDAGPGLIELIAEKVAPDPGKVEKLATLVLNNHIAEAMAAPDPASRAAAIEKLQSKAALFGLSKEDMRGLTSSLDDLSRATTTDDVNKAMKDLNDRLKAVEGRGAFTSGGMGQAFRGVAMGFAAFTLTNSVKGAIEDPNFETLLAAASDAVGLGEAGVSFAKSFMANANALSGVGGVLSKASTFASVLSVGVSTFQAAAAFAEGDVAKGSLLLASAAGSVAMLAGATGPGAVVVLGAALILGQLERVRASNRMETEHTQRFLEALGVSSELSWELRNADSEGNLVGVKLQVMADVLNVTPEALFDYLATLPPEQVKEIVETLHHVEVEEDGAPRRGEAPRPKYVPDNTGTIRGAIEQLAADEITFGSIPQA